MEKKKNKGGTPKGVSKPRSAAAKQTCGMKAEKRDGFSDVKLACQRFIRGRVERGEMREYGFEFNLGGSDRS